MKHREGGWGTLYVLVMYQNPAGDLYDTYYWTKYTSKYDVIDLEAERTENFFENLFTLDSRNESWWIYSEEEKQTALATMANWK